MEKPELQKDRDNIDINHDYIINLPADLKEKILLKLPLKEVVRTSILSSKWIDSWTWIPNLVFEENSTKLGFIKMVDQVLRVHQGPIQIFKLDCKHDCNEAIGRWMLILSRNNISDLELSFCFNKKCYIPFRFISCLALERVNLSYCIFNVPRFFNGFPFLHTLYLSYFSMPGFGIEKLVSNCPLLYHLTLHLFLQQGCLRILAPNLISLDIMGEFHDIYLETPKLASACVYLNPINQDFQKLSGAKHSKESNITRALGRLSNIQNLKITGAFSDYLAMGPVPENLPVIFNNLTEISLELRIGPDEIATALCLLQNAPNLKELNIEFYAFGDQGHVQGLWESKAIRDCLFKCLEFVSVTYEHGNELSLQCSKSMLEFAEFVLITAPLLEKFHVTELGDDTVFSQIIELPKLSEKCKVVFSEGGDEESDENVFTKGVDE
ncbi:F-box/FBD/LRR-repeat protein At1g13570-like [Carex rostrata]